MAATFPKSIAVVVLGADVADIAGGTQDDAAPGSDAEGAPIVGGAVSGGAIHQRWPDVPSSGGLGDGRFGGVAMLCD